MTTRARIAWVVAVVDIVVFMSTMAVGPSALTGLANAAVFAHGADSDPADERQRLATRIATVTATTSELRP